MSPSWVYYQVAQKLSPHTNSKVPQNLIKPNNILTVYYKSIAVVSPHLSLQEGAQKCDHC